MTLKKAIIILITLTLIIVIIFVLLYNIDKAKKRGEELMNNVLAPVEQVEKDIEDLTPEEKKELMLDILERGIDENESEEEKEQKKQEMIKVLIKNNDEVTPKNEQELAEDSKEAEEKKQKMLDILKGNN